MKDAGANLSFLDRVKTLIGVEPGTKLQPMIAYNSAIFFTGGGPYVIGSFLLPFLTKVEGLSTTQYGTVALFSCVVDAITDPIMGIITDRTRNRNGRHRPYLLWGVPFAALAYFLMWNSFGISAAGDSTRTMWWYVAMYMFYKTVSTFIGVPHTAMLPELAPGYNLRTQFNAVKTVMDAVASYTSFFIATLILGGLGGLMTTPTFSAAHRTRFAVMGAVLCLWTSLPLLWTYFGTHEHSSLHQVNAPLDLKAFAGQYVTVLRNRVFRRYFLFGFFTLFSSAFVSQCFYYFLESVLRQENSYSMLTLVSGVGEAAGFFPAYFFSIKKSKQLPAKVFVPVAMASLLTAWLLRGSGLPAVIFITEFFYGLGLAGMASVQSNIFPDVTDVDELITGERREGVIATFSTFIKKFVNGFAAFGIGSLLGWFGYDTALKAGEQSDRALFGVSLCFTLIPIFFLTLALISILRYNLTREKHRFIKALIQKKRTDGFAAVSDAEKQMLEDLTGFRYEEMWISFAESTASSGTDASIFKDGATDEKT